MPRKLVLMRYSQPALCSNLGWSRSKPFLISHWGSLMTKLYHKIRNYPEIIRHNYVLYTSVYLLSHGDLQLFQGCSNLLWIIATKAETWVILIHFTSLFSQVSALINPCWQRNSPVYYIDHCPCIGTAVVTPIWSPINTPSRAKAKHVGTLNAERKGKVRPTAVFRTFRNLFGGL